MSKTKHANNKLGVVLQIFSGGFKKSTTNHEAVIKRISEIQTKHKIDKVIIGWAFDHNLYEHIIDYLHLHNIEIYYWFPILSEIGLVEEVDLIIDFRGNEIKGYSLKEEENFEFYCPSSKKNYEAITKIFDSELSQHNFDGIFIDKIRSASFVNGLEGPFSCFCEECTNYYKNKGLDVDEIKKEIEKINQGGMSVLKNKEIKFSSSIENFFSVKKELYYDSTAKVIRYFKSKGKKVGADTFSSKMATYVGQDIQKLANICDFVKPMMYRYTNAPAGIEFEYKMMISNIVKTRENTQWVVDSNVLRDEAIKLTDMHDNIYFGIEVNRISEVADVYPKDIQLNMKTLDTENLQGFVFSWDLMSMPMDNLEAAFNYIELRNEVENG